MPVGQDRVRGDVGREGQLAGEERDGGGRAAVQLDPQPADAGADRGRDLELRAAHHRLPQRHRRRARDVADGAAERHPGREHVLLSGELVRHAGQGPQIRGLGGDAGLGLAAVQELGDLAADRLEQAVEAGLGVARGARDEHDDAGRRTARAQRQRDGRTHAVLDGRLVADEAVGLADLGVPERHARHPGLARESVADLEGQALAGRDEVLEPGTRRRPAGRAAQALVAAHPPQLGTVPAELAAEDLEQAGAGLLDAVGGGQQPHHGLLGGGVLVRAALVRDVADDAHEPGRQPVPPADRAHLHLGPAHGAGDGQEAMRVAQRGALAAQQRREGARVLGAVLGMDELPRRPAEAVLDGEAGRVGPGLAQMGPAPGLVGLEDAVAHALEHAAMALLAAAQAALGLAERGQVGVDDDGAEAAPVGGHDRPAALEQRAAALGGIDVHLDVAHLLAAQRAQQRRLVRAERRAVGMAQAEVLGPLERMQLVVDLAPVEGQEAAAGVRDPHALAELREHGRQELALLLQRQLQPALGADVAERQDGVRDRVALEERHRHRSGTSGRCARRPTRTCPLGPRARPSRAR